MKKRHKAGLSEGDACGEWGGTSSVAACGGLPITIAVKRNVNQQAPRENPMPRTCLRNGWERLAEGASSAQKKKGSRLRIWQRTFLGTTKLTRRSLSAPQSYQCITCENTLA